jgi:hypothetical protein
MLGREDRGRVVVGEALGRLPGRAALGVDPPVRCAAELEVPEPQPASGSSAAIPQPSSARLIPPSAGFLPPSAGFLPKVMRASFWWLNDMLSGAAC